MSTMLVKRIKQQLVIRGANLTGPCGAFAITGRVAWELNASGYGLFHKEPGRTHCATSHGRFGTDVLVTPDRLSYVDMLGDAGGANTPVWNVKPLSDPTVWRPPFDLDVASGPDVPDTPPTPTIPYNEAYSVEFGHACNAVYRESGAAFDPGMIAVHASRAAWDYYVGGMTWPDSLRKHVNEFRAVYALPQV